MRALRLTLLAIPLAALAVPLSAEAATVEFTVQPGCAAQTFTVPAGVSSIMVEAFGAQGGAGGLGGSATATLAVTQGQTLQVNVGGQGVTAAGGGAGGCNGGGLGGPFGGAGGGGGSDVRRGGTALPNRVVVAGGGGGVGGGGAAGGAGGGGSGGAGSPAAGGGGGGGEATQAAPGAAGSPNGNPGTGPSGGQGGGGFVNGGGGGGGGLFGGGGGGGVSTVIAGGGGGGGGSGFVPGGCTLAACTQGVRAGDGLVRITYTATAAVTFTSLAASRTAVGVLVRWRTASEIETLGFHVYREVNGHRVRVTRRLVPAGGSASGRAYSYLDRKAPRGKALRYWIQVVDLDGSRSWYGPARVAAGRTT